MNLFSSTSPNFKTCLGLCVLILFSTLLLLKDKPLAAENFFSLPSKKEVHKENPNRAKALEEVLKESLALKEQKALGEMSGRDKVLEETAKAYGFQAGFRYQYEEILGQVERHRDKFSKIFDFRRLLIDDKVLPPVIRASGRAVKLESDTLATEVEAQYQIISQAKIVLKPPSFEDYLLAETEVLKVSPWIKPKNKLEIERWKKTVEIGFKAGAEYAEEFFSEAMDKLISDYRGILQFKLLAKEGLVSVPILATGELGIQVGENRLALGQKIFRITLPASFIKGEPHGF